MNRLRKSWLPIITKPAWDGGGTTLYTDTLPQYLISSYGTQLHDFESTDNWTKVSGNNVAANASEYKTGSGSLKFSAETAYKLTGISWDCSASNLFEVWVYRHSGSGSLIALYFLNSTANFNTGFRVYIWADSWQTGWNCVRFAKTEMSKLGTGSWANPIVMFGVSMVNGDTVVSLDDLRMGVTGYGGFALTIDDSNTDQYTLAYPLFVAHNTRHTGYITSDSIGTENKLTAAQIAAMNADGCIMANHSKTHANFTELNQAQIETEISACAAAVAAAGGGAYAASHVGPPYGAGDGDADMIAAYTALSILTSRHFIEGNPETHCLETIPLLRIDGPAVIQADTALATVTDVLDICKARCQVAVFAFHGVVASGATGNEILASTLDSILAYAATIGIYHLTIEDIYQLTLGTRDVRRPV